MTSSESVNQRLSDVSEHFIWIILTFSAECTFVTDISREKNDQKKTSPSGKPGAFCIGFIFVLVVF